MAVSAKNKLLILGGGLIGLTIAHELARKGLNVEVLSRRRNEAAGFVAAGMLAPHAEGLSQGLLRLGQLSLERLPTWVKHIENISGISCGLKKCGIVVPFLHTDERDAYPTAIFGEKLNRKQLELEVTGIASQWEAGLLFTQDGQIDNRRCLMRALEKACVELGVKFQEGVEVLKIIHNKRSFQGVQICNAKGVVEILPGEKAVICGGAWSKQIFPELSIFPVKGQMLSLQAPKNALTKVIFGPGTYLVPRTDGLIVVGATSEQKAGFNEGLTPSGQQELHQGIDNLIPIANDWPPMERWWGFRPCTPDEAPLLGPSFIDGLWISTGHYRNGVLLAPITAELIAKSICEESLNPEEKLLLSNFRWDRFDRQL